MSTFLAFAVAAWKLFYAQPWSKILLLCFAVFVGGCICGVKLTRSAVKAVTVDTKPSDVDRFPRIKILKADEPEAVEAKPVPKMPEAVESFTKPLKPPSAPATASQPRQAPRPVAACVGGACYAPTRRLFGRWR